MATPRAQTGAAGYQNPYDDEEMKKMLMGNAQGPGQDPVPGLPQTPMRTPLPGGANVNDAATPGTSDTARGDALPPPTTQMTPLAYQTGSQVGLPSYGGGNPNVPGAEPQGPATATNPYMPSSADPNDDPTGTGGGPPGPVANPDSDQNPADPNNPNPDPAPAPTQPKPGTPGPNTSDWAHADYSDPNNIRGFFQSKGIMDPAQLDRLAQTWGAYWQQWGSRDPQEFFRRMQDENDLTGSNARGGGGGVPAYQTDPQVEEAIRKLLARGFTTPTGDDPSIRAQFNPTSQVIQHNNTRAKSAAAERNFASGQTGQGANDVASAQIDQASGQDESSLMGSLIGSELAARRQDVANALNYAQGEERLALQQLLGQYDVELRRLGLNQQNQQYYDDLGFRIGQSASAQNPT